MIFLKLHISPAPKVYFMSANKKAVILSYLKRLPTGHAEEQIGSFCYLITFIDMLL